MILLGLIAFSIFNPKPTFAVYFATNRILIYENGKRITDNSIIHDRNYGNPVCKKGRCLVGQQYEVVTFFKTNRNDILSHEEWTKNWYLTHEGCEGFSNHEDAIRKALEEWRNTSEYKEAHLRIIQANDVDERQKIWNGLEPAKIVFMKSKGFDFFDNPECKKIDSSDYFNVYMEEIKEKAIYSVTASLPPPEGGAGCGYPGCIGGRVGNHRTLKVDIQQGNATVHTSSMFKDKLTHIFLITDCFIKGIFGKYCDI